MTTLTIAGGATIDHGADWAGFKEWIDGTLAQLKYTWAEDATAYTVVATDGPFFRTVGIDKADPPSATQEEFETYYKAGGRTVVEPRTADGRISVRVSAANRTRNFSLKVFCFEPGDASTLKDLAMDFTEASEVTMTCYDTNGEVTTDPLEAVTSVLDYEPAHAYEVIGGWIDVPPAIIGGVTGDWWIAATGVPDVPAILGGSIPFVTPTNLELTYTAKVVSDGRAVQYLSPHPTYHTNKLRWTLKHPTGHHALFQIYVETFR